MRYDRNKLVFCNHKDWYTFTQEKGYEPTEKAPEEARNAMKEYNSYRDKINSK